MPHYKDGSPAEIGDQVKGVPYNTGGRQVVGTIVQITEGTDTCNCVVAFVETKVVDLPVHAFYSHGLPIPHHVRRITGGRVPHPPTGETLAMENVLVLPKTDYGALKDFEKIA